MASGRCVMANPGFTRMTGYAQNEVVGRTASEIGLWHDLADRDACADDRRARPRRHDGRL
jgi:PAS domain S-box-containing protein